MDNKSDFNDEIQAAMSSLDGLNPASPGPFFITRVQARLSRVEKNVWEKVTTFVARPVVAITMVAFILLMNTVAVLEHKKSSNLSLDPNDQSIYEEFNVAANNFYDYEIKEP